MSSSGDELWSLPASWAWVTMSDVAEVVGGGTPDTKIPENFGGNIPWVTPADMSTHVGKSISGGARSLTEQGMTGSGARWLPKGAILFSSRAPIGYTAIASQPVTTNQGFKSFVLADQILPDYAYHWLSSAKEHAEKLASGTTFLEISGAKAALLPFPLAPEPEQSRVVEKLEELLSELDAAVAELKAAQRKLAQYRQSLLKAAVEGVLTADWRVAHERSKESGAELLQRILSERRACWEQNQQDKYAEQKKVAPTGWQTKYSEPLAPDLSNLPALPEGWVWVSLDQLLVKLRSGTAETSGRDVTAFPVLKSSAVRQGAIDFTALNYLAGQQVKEENYLALQDLLITRLSGSVEYVGCAAVVSHLPDGGVQYPDRVFCGKVVPGFEALGDYLAYCLRSPSARTRIEAAAKSTAGHKRISLSDLQPFPIPLPPLVELRTIVDRLNTFLGQSDETEASTDRGLHQAAAQRKNLLKAAFAGRLVPQDPNDEPASELQARIRAERANYDGAAPRRRRNTA